MVFTNSGKNYVRILGMILVLAYVALGVVQLGRPATFVDPYGFLFVLVGGMALVMISFPGAEIGRAFRDAATAPGNETDIRSSTHFWEAAGRGFWILGVLCSVLNLKMGFVALATDPGGMQMITNKTAQSLLVALYGILLAVICFLPYWKLMGRLKSAQSALATEPVAPSSARPSRRLGAALGYVLFIFVSASLLLPNVLKLSLPVMLWMGYRPAMLVVLGGTIALMLFMGGAGSGPMLSTAFAAMGLIGSLMGCVQMIYSMTMSGPSGIAHLAGALEFVLSSCLTALLGMALAGAPAEDRAIRTGRISAPSVLSRVAWYVFPLLALIFSILVFVMLVMPLTRAPQ